MSRIVRMIATTLLVSAIGAIPIGCSPDVAEEPAPPPASPPPSVPSEPPIAEEPSEPPAREEPTTPGEIAWLDVELVDVQTGETFRISDFRGRPVLLKSFAVW